MNKELKTYIDNEYIKQNEHKDGDYQHNNTIGVQIILKFKAKLGIKIYAVVVLSVLVLIGGISAVSAEETAGDYFKTEGENYFDSEIFTNYTDELMEINKIYEQKTGSEGFLSQGVENSFAYLESNGNSNFADIEQSEAANLAKIMQFGNNNRARIRQLSENNRAFISQNGNLNRALIIQRAANNYANISQSGNNNTAEIRQLNSGNSAIINQVGIGNEAFITQN